MFALIVFTDLLDEVGLSHDTDVPAVVRYLPDCPVYLGNSNLFLYKNFTPHNKAVQQLTEPLNETKLFFGYASLALSFQSVRLLPQVRLYEPYLFLADDVHESKKSLSQWTYVDFLL